jgi:hypothetical protein
MQSGILFKIYEKIPRNPYKYGSMTICDQATIYAKTDLIKFKKDQGMLIR